MSKEDQVETFYEKLGIPYVDIPTAKQLCRQNLEAGFVPCLIGEAGIGKTAICRQLIEEYQATGTFFYLAHMEREDIGGIPFPNKEKNAYKYLCEETIFEIAKLKTTHFLILDEWNRGTKDVMNAVFTLMEQRRFGSTVLPPQIKLMATMNPSAENYLVNETENDPAFRRRLAWIGLYTDPGNWLSWAEKNNIDIDIRKFIASNPSALNDDVARQAGKVYANPAAWERISKLRTLAKKQPFALQQALYAGHIGQAQAAQFMTWVTNADVAVDLESLLTDFNSVKSKIKNLVETNEKRALLTQTVEGSALWLANKNALPANIGDNIGEFLQELPEELKMLFFSMLVKTLKGKDAQAKLVFGQLMLSEKYRKEFTKLADLKTEIAQELAAS